jgi:hypothetical protein
MKNINKTLENIEKGNAWEDSDEVVQIEIKKPLDKVIPVRLSSEKWEELRRKAKELGIGPTTLTRMWILERLRQNVKVYESFDRVTKHAGKEERADKSLVKEDRSLYGKGRSAKKI